MKVLLINGSAKPKGCTYTALLEVSKSLQTQGIETELIHIGYQPIRDCIGCNACRNSGGRCAFDDGNINEFIEKAKQAEGFVFGSPVYYAHPSGRLLSFIDRAFYANSAAFAFKPAAAVVSARRAGTTASLDTIMKHFTINKMPVISSSYWNMVHGNTPEQVMEDKEGLQIMRHIGLNMAWILKCIEAGKNAGINKPELDEKIMTNFIR